MAIPPKPKPKAKPDPKAAETPDLERHDEVYFRGDAGPMCGRVLSSGAHGAIIEVEGARHKMHWERYLGHKVRVRPDVKVVSSGEDGLLVEGPAGDRRFIRDELGAKPMAKSLMPAVLFFTEADAMAKAIANRPGLTLQSVTDKAGHQTKRWKRSSKPVPKVRAKAAEDPARTESQSAKPRKVGDEVSFTAGDFKGTGKIVGKPGKDGAHVIDSAGREHGVAWSEMHDGGKPGPEHDAAPKREPEKPDWSPREDGEADKPYAKRVIDKGPSPEHLPEEYGRYFNMDGATVVPLSKLKSTKSAEENAQGGDNGPKRMLAAYHGHLGKRDPIEVSDNGDGTYNIEDGNGTFTSATKLGWHALPVKIVPAGSHGDEPPGAGGDRFFPDTDVDALPPVAKQPFNTWEELAEHAPAALDEFKSSLGKVAKALGLKGDLHIDDMTHEHADNANGYVFVGPLKKKERAERKIGEYEGDWDRVRDIVRGTISVSNLDELAKATRAVEASGLTIAQKPKDKFATPTDVGYRDLNTVVKLPGGMLAELQYHVKHMTVAKAEGHDHYVVSSGLETKYDGKPDDASWSEADRKSYRHAVESQKKLYGDAWEAANRKRE